MELTIRLTDLQFHAHHGVFEQESVVGNDFIVSVEITVPWSFDEESDDLTSSISYADVYSVVEHIMTRPANMLETVAIKIVNVLREKWPVILSGEVTVCKPHPPIPRCMGQASVSIKF